MNQVMYFSLAYLMLVVIEWENFLIELPLDLYSRNWNKALWGAPDQGVILL